MILPFSFHFYGLFIALGLIFVYLYLKENSKRFNLPFSLVESGYLFGVFFAILGARAYHVLSSFPYYFNHPLRIFFVWEGGLGIFGLIFGVFWGLFVFSKFKKIDLWNLLNLFFPPLLVAQALGRIGNFVNYEGFGQPTNLTWKVFIPIIFRPARYISYSYFHPTFFYESFLCLIAFFLYFFLRKRLKRNDFGFAYYLVAYGLIRFFTEFFRLDTWTIYSFKIAYLLSFLLVILGLVVFKLKKSYD